MIMSTSLTESTSSTVEDVQYIFSMLKSGDEYIELSRNKDIALVLGNTGAGKTTLTHHLTGDGRDLISKEIFEGSGDYVIEDMNEKISTDSTILSKTLYPERIVDFETGTIFYDCPGFIDTRSVAHDIAATYFVKKVIDSSQRVKLIFVVNHSSVRKGVDRNDFMLLLTHATNLIKDVSKFKDSIALVITKVENKYVRKGRTFTLVPDDVVISSIVEFIKNVKKNIVMLSETPSIESKNQQFYQKAEQLIDIFLQFNGNYTRIGLFRRPDMGGPLINIELLQEGKKKLKNMIHGNILFTPKYNSDFGYTISAQSKNYVQDLGQEIKEMILYELASIGYEIEIFFEIEESLATDIYEIQNKFNFGISIISKFAENDYINKKGFVNEMVQSLNALYINIPEEYIFNVLNYLSYLDFLCEVSGKSLLDSLEWSKGFFGLTRYLNNSKKWYNFLINLHNWLSEYSVQQNIDRYKKSGINFIQKHPLFNNNLIKTNETDIQIFLNEITVNSQVKNAYNDVNKSNLNKGKYEALKRVINSTLNYKVETSCIGPDKLLVQGHYVKLSDIVRENQCPQKIKFVEIFASRKVFIDINLNITGEELNLSIISPIWDVLGDRLIILDGKVGDSLPKARDGYYREARGDDGQPGLPGGNAGNFLGLARTVQGGKLTIFSRGGKGGPGQEGGNGAPGRPGRDAPEAPSGIVRTVFNEWGPEYFWDDMNVHWQVSKSSENYVFTAWYYYKALGQSATRGGHGGNGGIGGKGGHKGHVVMIDLSNSKKVFIENVDGDDGDKGAGGEGGSAAPNGLTRDVECRIDRVIIVSITTCQNGQYSYGGMGDMGMDGESGISHYGPSFRTLPKRATGFVKPSLIINAYKKYLRENLSSSIQEGYLLEFISKLDSTDTIESIYDTLGLVDELKVLEDSSFNFDESRTNLRFYESLLTRINKYSMNPKANEKNIEYKKVLSSLYTATLSKLSSFAANSKNNIILDVQKYFSIVINNIKMLKTLRSELAAMDIKNFYLADIERQINNTNSILDTKALPEVDYIFKDINKKIKLLISNTLYKINDTDREYELIYKQQEELEQSIFLKILLRPIALISDFLGIFSPSIENIIQIAQDVEVISDSLNLLGSNKPNNKSDIKHFLHSLTNILHLTFGKISNINHEEEELLGFQLTDISSILVKHIGKSNSTLSQFYEHIENAKEKLSKVNENGIHDRLEFPDRIRNDVNEILEHQKSADIRDNLSDSEVLNDLNLIQSLLNVTDIPPELYRDIKDDQNKLIAMGNTFKNIKEKKKALREFENNIYRIIIPKCEQLQSVLNNAEKHLPGESRVMLIMQGWNIQKTIKDVKFEIQRLTTASDIGEDLTHCFEKLIEAMSYITNIYGLLDGYYEKVKLATYIAHVTSKPAADIRVGNSELQSALMDLSYTIKANLILEQYNRAMEAFTQYIFPFAHLYLDEYMLPLSMYQNGTDHMLSLAINKIEKLQSNLLSSSISINEYDKYIHKNIKFTSQMEHASPFYIWENASNKKAIQKLLQGREIILKSDVTKGVKKSAVKFRTIGINLNAGNKTVQSMLNKDLSDFKVMMTHFGNSYFKCGNKYYIITSEKLTFIYHWMKDSEGIPVDRNLVYDKVKTNEYILSPYALWSIKLFNETQNFYSLKKYMDEIIDLELEGIGQYVDEDKIDLNICNKKMDHYYNQDDIMPRAEIDIRMLSDYSNSRDKRDFKTPPAKNGAYSTIKTPYINTFLSSIVTGFTSVKYILSFDQIKSWVKAEKVIEPNYHNTFDYPNFVEYPQISNSFNGIHKLDTVDAGPLTSWSNLLLWDVIIRTFSKNKYSIKEGVYKTAPMSKDSHILAYSYYAPKHSNS